MKWLSILVLLVALSAHAVSVEDWEKKSSADRAEYLAACVVGLAVEIAKTDRPLAVNIREWYTVKPAGKTYTEGVNAVFTRLEQLKKQEKDGKADLSKIEIEDIVYSVTAEKFKLPPREAPQDLGGFKDMAPAKSPAPSATAPVTPPAPRATPIMVGKIDVSHFAGVKPGDTPAQVASVYGAPVTDQGFSKWYGAGHLIVQYVDGGAKVVEFPAKVLDMARSRAGNDALLDLFGQTEADAIALLGPPKGRQDEDTHTYYLFWFFPIPGHHPVGEGEFANLASDQTLTLEFSADSGCFWVKLRW